jgi:DNA-binding MarR family transcriptional regulator
LNNSRIASALIESRFSNGKLASAYCGIVEKPLSVAQIARNMGVARQSVQRLADNLERQGIVEYAPNPDHGRAKLVRLNELKGNKSSGILTSKVNMCDTAAADARQQMERLRASIRKLRFAVRTYEENAAAGIPWPGSENAATRN